MLPPFLEALRPRQWTKNVVVFAPLLFARRLLEPEPLARATLAFLSFCLLSGAIYVLNDLLDLEQDRKHPVKRNRPLASGRLSPGTAYAELAIVLGLGLGIAFLLSPSLVTYVKPSDPGMGRDSLVPLPSFASCGILYVLIQVAYGYRLKHIVILDVMTIAAGFLLRAMGGAAVIGVDFSHWLLICTIFLALFLALTKRRHELVLLAAGAAGHRRTLEEYDEGLLDQMIVVVASASLISYGLYTMAPDTVAKFGTDRLNLTIPFVLYGLFRYLYLAYRRADGGDPSSSLLLDRPLLAAVFLWAIAVVIVLYLGGR